jgi:hypothetical protein
LNGDQFLKELKNGDTTGKVTQLTDILGGEDYFYQWTARDFENPAAIIQLMFNYYPEAKAGVTLFRLTIQESAETELWEEAGEIRQAKIDLRP